MANWATIEVEDTDGVRTIWLNRPERLNAFTTEMGTELASAIQEAGNDDDVRALVVAGRGRAFSAGMELDGGRDGVNVFGLDPELRPTLTDLRSRPEDPVLRDHVRDSGGRLTLAIRESPKPIVAAIHGPAVGIGVTMTLPMDVRIAGEEARFGFVFGRIGVVPEALSSWYLPRIVGLPNALELTLGADVIDAVEAHGMGLVRKVVPTESVLSTAIEFADSMTRDRSPVGVALTRQMMHRNSALEDPFEAHLIESMAMFEMARGDGEEGIAAFRDKRTPRFRSRVSRDMPDFYPWWTE